mmetsp:Transcript_24807/g.58933  ORF Transcript_24807/g.58933 Transcript_24807/m.58933 type:complete len:83 (+) Transcript_24807:650-898(+)
MSHFASVRCTLDLQDNSSAPSTDDRSRVLSRPAHDGVHIIDPHKNVCQKCSSPRLLLADSEYFPWHAAMLKRRLALQRPLFA